MGHCGECCLTLLPSASPLLRTSPLFILRRVGRSCILASLCPCICASVLRVVLSPFHVSPNPCNPPRRPGTLCLSPSPAQMQCQRPLDKDPTPHLPTNLSSRDNLTYPNSAWGRMQTQPLTEYEWIRLNYMNNVDLPPPSLIQAVQLNHPVFRADGRNTGRPCGACGACVSCIWQLIAALSCQYAKCSVRHSGYRSGEGTARLLEVGATVWLRRGHAMVPREDFTSICPRMEARRQPTRYMW